MWICRHALDMQNIANTVKQWLWPCILLLSRSLRWAFDAEVGTFHLCQVMYPSYVVSGQGLVIVNRYRFIFERFRANRYFFGVLYLCRTALVIQWACVFYQEWGVCPKIWLYKVQRGNMVINHGFWLGLPTYFHGKKRCFRSRNTFLSLIPVAFANYPSVPWSRLLSVSIVMVGYPFIAGWFNVENGTSIRGWWNWGNPLLPKRLQLHVPEMRRKSQPCHGWMFCPKVQVTMLAAVMLLGMIVQMRAWPWRTKVDSARWKKRWSGVKWRSELEPSGT